MCFGVGERGVGHDGEKAAHVARIAQGCGDKAIARFTGREQIAEDFVGALFEEPEGGELALVVRCGGIDEGLRVLGLEVDGLGDCGQRFGVRSDGGGLGERGLGCQWRGCGGSASARGSGGRGEGRGEESEPHGGGVFHERLLRPQVGV